MRSRSARVLSALLAASVAGCAVRTGPRLLDSAGWAEAVKRRGVEPATTPDPLGWDDAMRRAALVFAGRGTHLDRLERLQDALFDSRRFPFRYDVDGTWTAPEAFRSRAGNCLAFTSLFIAMGRALGIPVRAASPLYSAGSERVGDLIVVNTHVVAVYPKGDGLAVFDFDKSRSQAPIAVVVLDDLRLTSLYLNNVGVQALRRGDVDRAVALLEDAAKLAPDSQAALGNLGVARRRTGDIPGAFDAYRAALAVAPRDPTILSNLAGLYSALGRTREAQAALEVADVAGAPLHVLLVRADLEIARGRTDDARKFCRRARSVAPRDPAGWICSARVALLRGEPRAASRALDKAVSLRPDDPELRRQVQEIRPPAH